MRVKSHILNLFLISLLTSCGLLGSSNLGRSKLNVSRDSILEIGDTQIEVKKDSGIELPKESFIVRSTGMIPVFVVPLNSQFKQIDLNLSPLESKEVEGVYKKQINKSLSLSLFDVHEIQSEIFSKNYNRALSLIQEAEKKYGDIDYLSYMKSSVFYLSGETDRAKRILEDLIANGNENQEVKQFLDEIN